MKQHLWEISRAVLPHRHVFDFNQALMDFGATVCTARKPQCMLCPMSEVPLARSSADARALDSRATSIVVLAAVIERDGRSS